MCTHMCVAIHSQCVVFMPHQNIIFFLSAFCLGKKVTPYDKLLIRCWAGAYGKRCRYWVPASTPEKKPCRFCIFPVKGESSLSMQWSNCPMPSLHWKAEYKHSLSLFSQVHHYPLRKLVNCRTLDTFEEKEVSMLGLVNAKRMVNPNQFPQDSIVNHFL